MIQNLATFDETIVDSPPTQGVKYAGSKRKLLPHILALARKVDARVVLDGFSGSTRVSQAFAQAGYRVIANDTADWSEAFGRCYLLNDQPPSAYAELIRHLNSVAPQDGWFTAHYGGLPNRGCSVQRDALKKPWQAHNTRKLDGIRDEIDRLSLSELERAVALTSLLLALDQVDNTLGHFAAYLKNWSPRSYHDLELKVPRLFPCRERHEVYRGDVFRVADHAEAALAYYDPPYGSNNEKMPPSRVRYASYYHLWTTICRHDRPELFGKARRRLDSSDRVAGSVFEEFRRNKAGGFLAVEAIQRLIRRTQARWIILSYSSGGRATADELNRVLCDHGHVLEVLEVDHQRNVMSSMKWTNEWTRDAAAPNREFLFLVERR